FSTVCGTWNQTRICWHNRPVKLVLLSIQNLSDQSASKAQHAAAAQLCSACIG
ncbi:hypothetical protein STEG23_008958, partial [Scotinomys teguina]